MRRSSFHRPVRLSGIGPLSVRSVTTTNTSARSASSPSSGGRRVVELLRVVDHEEERRAGGGRGDRVARLPQRVDEAFGRTGSERQDGANAPNGIVAALRLARTTAEGQPRISAIAIDSVARRVLPDARRTGEDDPGVARVHGRGEPRQLLVAARERPGRVHAPQSVAATQALRVITCGNRGPPDLRWRDCDDVAGDGELPPGLRRPARPQGRARAAPPGLRPRPPLPALPHRVPRRGDRRSGRDRDPTAPAEVAARHRGAQRRRHARHGPGRRCRGAGARERRALAAPALVLGDDRRGPHLRHARAPVRPRAAPPALLLHPHADGCADVAPQQRRHRRAAGRHQHHGHGGEQRHQPRRDAHVHARARVAPDDPHAARAPALHHPGPAGRAEAPGADPRVDAAQRGDEQHRGRALQRRRRARREALRQPQPRAGPVLRPGRPRPRHRRAQRAARSRPLRRPGPRRRRRHRGRLLPRRSLRDRRRHRGRHRRRVRRVRRPDLHAAHPAHERTRRRAHGARVVRARLRGARLPAAHRGARRRDRAPARRGSHRVRPRVVPPPARRGVVDRLARRERRDRRRGGRRVDPARRVVHGGAR